MKTVFLISAALTAAAAAVAHGASPRDILPMPAITEVSAGEFRPRSGGISYFAKGCEAIVDSLLAPFAQKAESANEADIIIGHNRNMTDTYIIRIESSGITLGGRDDEGVFYGVQSLIQLLGDSTIACGEVIDRPAFPYRGMHVDVSRHFRPLAFLKKQIDAMALLKMNKMHLHLTDGAGWRMPSESYPRLNSLAAWRPQRRWKDWTDNGATYCSADSPGAYGGFYTKDELRELVKYASERHIEVIPEIEMPGHSEEVIAAYPELSCTGEGGDLCPGKEATFRFIEAILDETMEIFPSHYIHIGGDEASKRTWRECGDCRARMEAEGIADVDGLQSYLIGRAERHVNARGRCIIGWDEIIDGGLAPNATVMSWRGLTGGIEAMRAGHDVIMTPGEACYLDYTQDAPFKEPESIGGYLPLAKVYAYDPLAGLPADVDTNRLIGLQANLWAEYITDDSHAEYMYYPRTLAIAEIGWSNPRHKDFADFRRRAARMAATLSERGYTTFDINTEYGERPASLQPCRHLALGAKVTYTKRYTSVYPAAGDGTLTDGIRGGWTYQDKKWQGWFSDLDLTVDLGEAKQLHYINTSFMHCPGPGVFLPDSVVISTSADGVSYTEQAVLRQDVAPSYQKIMIKDFGTPVNVNARYINIKGIRNKKIGGCLFTDEIVIN